MLIEQDFASNPEIKDFGVAMDIEVKGEKIFEEHLNKEDCMIGIWQGKLFEGWLMISWFNIEEATVMLWGIKADVLIKGLDLNRAISMDVVAVEIFDQSKWIWKGA